MLATIISNLSRRQQFYEYIKAAHTPQQRHTLRNSGTHSAKAAHTLPEQANWWRKNI